MLRERPWSRCGSGGGAEIPGWIPVRESRMPGSLSEMPGKAAVRMGFPEGTDLRIG